MLPQTIKPRRNKPRFKCHAPWRYFPCPKRPYEDGNIWDLNEKEFKVYHYLLFKTWGFNKPSDAISADQMRQGITDPKSGMVIQAGLGYSLRTLRRVLKGLEKSGWIKKRRTGPNPSVYEVLNPMLIDGEMTGQEGCQSFPKRLAKRG